MRDKALPLIRPRRFLGVLVAVGLLAMVALMLSHVDGGIKILVGITLMATFIGRAWYWWQNFPSTLMVGDRGVAVIYPPRWRKHAFRREESVEHWRSPIIGEWSVSMRSSQGWCLLPQESFRPEDWLFLRLHTQRH